MRDSLLWVYEGQTQYWGSVLAARSGLWTPQQALDALAMTAAVYEHRVGRVWRPLEDTTSEPIITMRRPLSWRSWQRGEDYYAEGLLIWLDVDTLIREQSRGRRSLDDFAKAFFGINNGSYVPVTYTFEDVVKTLNDIQPYDWSTLLRDRLAANGPAPLDGLRRGGYRLIYTDTPSDYFKASEARRKITDLTYSLGIVIASDGRLTDVQWEGPAYEKGLTVGNQIIAVNGIAYSAERLKDALKDKAKTAGPIDLLMRDGDRYRTVSIEYHGGLRYPHLQRDTTSPAILDQIFAARN
jgi:predicted metalloprotease with PDZ domain